jgi:hypothetical protein
VYVYFFFMTQQILVGQKHFSFETSRSHSHTSHSVVSSGLVISLTQIPVPDNTQQSHEKNLDAPGGFEPTIPTSERSQIHALVGAAAVIP